MLLIENVLRRCEQSFDFYGNAVEFNKIKGGIIESDTYYEHMTATPAQHTETKTLLLIFLLGILYFVLFLFPLEIPPLPSASLLARFILGALVDCPVFNGLTLLFATWLLPYHCSAISYRKRLKLPSSLLLSS